MAGPRRLESLGKAGSSLGGDYGGLRYLPDGTAVAEPPRAGGAEKTYEEIARKLLGEKTARQAQKARKLDKKTGQYVAATSEEPTRNRPDFIFQAMLSPDPEKRALVKRIYDSESDEQRAILRQEIAEAFRDAQLQAPGGSPLYQEVMTFLETGEISPQRLEVLQQEAALADSGLGVVREKSRLPPGHPDAQQVTENMDALDQAVEFAPAGIDDFMPNDPLLTVGTRPFEQPKVNTTHLRTYADTTALDPRPDLRVTENIRVRGDNINPKKEKWTTQWIEGTVDPTPEQIAAHRTAWMRSKINEIEPDHPRLNELSPEFMERVLESRGIAIEPGPPPARTEVPVRMPQSGDTVGPQDAGRVFAGQKFEAASAARTARMEQAIADEFGMDIDDVREQMALLQQSGDADGLKDMQARIQNALKNADLGPYPEKPYDSISRASDLRAASSVAEGGEQGRLADALDQLGTGRLGSEDRIFRMLLKKASRDTVGTPTQAGLADAETMADYAIAQIRNSEVLGRIAANKGYETWRQRVIEALHNRFYRQDQPPRVLTRDEAAKIDAEIDAQAGDPEGEWGITEVRDRDNKTNFGRPLGMPPARTAEDDSQYSQALEAFQRQIRAPGYMSPEVPLAAAPAPPAAPPPATPMAPGGNVGRLGEPRSLRESQAQDAFPQGIDQYGRPVSAIEGRNPTGGRKTPGHVNSPVDRYRGSEGLENLSAASENIGGRRTAGVPISPEPGAGVLDVQASALENSVLYANQRGKVVWLDPDSGNVLAAYITPKMKPERVAEIRESARALSPSSGEVFDYYWPAGGFPSPEFHRWNVGQAPDAVPEGYVPPRATEATRTPQGEIDDELARMREADDAELQRAREYYAQFGITGDKPPGFVQRPDGRVVRSRFGADPDEPDPNDLFNDAGAFDNTDEVPLGDMDAAPDAPAPVATPDDGAWDSVDTLLDADGNPLSPEAAAAEDWGREVVRILSDPASTPEDLEKARQIHEALKRGFDNLPDAQRQAEFQRDVLDPIEQQLRPPEDDPDALTPIDEESSDFVVPLDDVEDNLNAAATPLGPTPQPQPQPTPAPGPTPQPQPQPQPQPTPSPQPAPGPTPNPGATPGATPTPNPTPSPGATPGAAPGGTPNPTPNAGAAPGGTPTPQPAPTRTMSQRAYDHFARNYGKYGIGIPLAGVGLSLYQSMRNSDPFPNALDPLMPEDGEGMSVGGGMAAEAGMPGSGAGMKSMTPEQRIRAIIRAKELEAADESRHAPQTIWRHF